MAEKNDGGPAFPSGDGEYSGGPNHAYGISLRDYLAIQALVGIGEWVPMPKNGNGVNWASWEHPLSLKAEWAYAQADAMIAARGGSHA